MARPKNSAGLLTNPVSLGLLAIFLLLADLVANQLETNPIETMIVGLSGVLFGLALANVAFTGKKKDQSLAVSLIVIYLVFFGVLYFAKLINV